MLITIQCTAYSTTIARIDQIYLFLWDSLNHIQWQITITSIIDALCDLGYLNKEREQNSIWNTNIIQNILHRKIGQPWLISHLNPLQMMSPNRMYLIIINVNTVQKHMSRGKILHSMSESMAKYTRIGATVDKLQHRSPTLIYSISTLQTIMSKQINTRVSFAHAIFVESKV